MKLLLLFLIVACLSLIGCPSYSVHPLYTDQDAVVESALEGTWSSSDPNDREAIRFQKSGDYEYSLSIFHSDTKVNENYKVHLVRLGDQMFMDLIADDQTVGDAKLDGPVGVIATHVILKVTISADDLAYATLEDDTIRKQSAAGGAALDYQMVNGGVLVTTPTDALRRYISAHVQDAFSKVQHLKRKGKAPYPTIARRFSNSGETKRSTEQARWQHHRRPDQRQHSVDSDPHHSEGQQQQPHDRIEDQRQQGQGPAQHEEKAPEQESNHK